MFQAVEYFLMVQPTFDFSTNIFDDWGRRAHITHCMLLKVSSCHL